MKNAHGTSWLLVTAFAALACAHSDTPSAPAPLSAPSPAAPRRDLSTDRDQFFGPSRCQGSELLFCEDFEAPTLDGARWKVEGPAPTLDGVQVARGKQALHVVVQGKGLSRIRTKQPFPAANNSYFGRMFVLFGSLPTAPMPYSHWTFLAAQGEGVKGEIRLGGQLQGGRNRFGVGTDNRTPAGTGDWTNVDKENPGVPQMQWLCLEWQHDGARNETRFFWNGEEHPSVGTSPHQHGGRKDVPFILPTFSSLWVGWQEYQPTGQRFELWIDEVALDSRRIGCVM